MTHDKLMLEAVELTAKLMTDITHHLILIKHCLTVGDSATARKEINFVGGILCAAGDRLTNAVSPDV